MAVFLLKAKLGLCYVPPACTGVFDDVACPSIFAAWIEDLAARGITGGCGGDNYCPANPVRRDQMAVFLLKTKYGSSYVPPPCDGDFDDVPCPSQLRRLDRAARGGADHRRAAAATTTARSTPTPGARWRCSSLRRSLLPVTIERPKSLSLPGSRAPDSSRSFGSRDPESVGNARVRREASLLVQSRLRMR